MDRSKKKDDKQSLYEIYRACRLCGAGGGYKMPIIQNFLQIDGEEIDLKQKIRECLQLEVNLEDRMPPLICELCVDKVNDFYEFLNVCRLTNTQTRMRLGLPLKNSCKDSATETCMLGLVEASALKAELEEPPFKKAKKIKINKDIEQIKQDIPITKEKSKDLNPAIEKLKNNNDKSLKDINMEKEIKSKESLVKEKGALKRTTRNSLEDLVMTKVKDLPIKPLTKAGPKSMLKELRNLIGNTEEESNIKSKSSSKPGPKSMKEESSLKSKPSLKPGPKSMKEESSLTSKPSLKPGPKSMKEESSLKSKPSLKPGPKSMKEEELKRLGSDPNEEANLRLKRSREKDTKELPPPTKKAKPDPKTEKTTPPKTQKPSPKPTSKPAIVSKKVQPIQKADKFQCPACTSVMKNTAGFTNHMIHCHPVTWTSDNLACNACREWFPTINESIAHHKKHANYKCLKCKKKFKNGVLYHQHVENKKCIPDNEVPDVKCIACWRLFPTKNLLKEHKCLGPDGRPGGKCRKCNRNYTLLKNLRKHESTCTFLPFIKRTVEPIIDPEVKSSLLPMEVRITKCDDLLEYGPVVSACTVPHRYGLDKRRSYPYMPKLRVIKKPVFVPTPEPNTTEMETADLEWEDFLTTRTENTLKNLSTLCLKTIFSDKMLGYKLVLDDEDYQKRLSLKRKIDSIIFKVDESNSCDSNSILDKNTTITNFDDVISDINKVGNENSDSTVYDEIASGFRSNDETTSGNIMFDLLTSQSDAIGSKDFANDDETDSQNESRNDGSSRDNDLLNEESTSSQNHLENESSSKTLEIETVQTDNSNFIDNMLNNINSENNLTENNQNTTFDDKLDKNNDLCDTDTNMFSKGNTDIDVNNVKLNDSEAELDPNSRTSIITDDSQSTNTVNQTDSNINEHGQVSLNGNDTNLHVNNDKTDQNTNYSDKIENSITVNTEKGEIKNVESSNSILNSTDSTNGAKNNFNLVTNDGLQNIDTNDTIDLINNTKITESYDTSKPKNDLEKNTVNDVHNKESSISTNDVNNLDTKDTNSLNINHETESIHLENNTNTKSIIDIKINTSNSTTAEHLSTNTDLEDSQNHTNIIIDKKSENISANNENNNVEENISNDFKNSKTNNITEENSRKEKFGDKDSENYHSGSVNDSSQNANDGFSNANDNINNDKDGNINNDNDITNKNDTPFESPTKNIDFSITSILNHDNTKENCNQIKNAPVESTEIDNSNHTTVKSNENKNSSADNISLHEATDDSCNSKENDNKNDKVDKNNDDSMSLNSLKFIDSSADVDKVDKFNVNDLSEDEKRLMAELDEQIGENNDKPDFDALSENYDFNV